MLVELIAGKLATSIQLQALDRMFELDPEPGFVVPVLLERLILGTWELNDAVTRAFVEKHNLILPSPKCYDRRGTPQVGVNNITNAFRLVTSPPRAQLFERFRYRCAAADWAISELPKGKRRQVRVPFFRG